MKKSFYFFFMFFLISCTNLYAQVGIGVDSSYVNSAKEKAKLFVVEGTVLKIDGKTKDQVEIVKVSDSVKKNQSKSLSQENEPQLVKRKKVSKKLEHHLKVNHPKELEVIFTYQTNSPLLQSNTLRERIAIMQTTHQNDIKAIVVVQTKLAHHIIVKKTDTIQFIADRILNEAISHSILSRPPPFAV